MCRRELVLHGRHTDVQGPVRLWSREHEDVIAGQVGLGESDSGTRPGCAAIGHAGDFRRAPQDPVGDDGRRRINRLSGLRPRSHHASRYPRMDLAYGSVLGAAAIRQVHEATIQEHARAPFRQARDRYVRSSRPQGKECLTRSSDWCRGKVLNNPISGRPRKDPTLQASPPLRRKGFALYADYSQLTRPARSCFAYPGAG